MPLTARRHAVQHRRRPATAVAAKEQVVLAADADLPQLPLAGVVVDVEETMLGVAQQRRPVVQRVADRLGDGTLGQHLLLLFLQPAAEVGQERHRLRLAALKESGVALLGRGRP